MNRQGDCFIDEYNEIWFWSEHLQRFYVYGGDAYCYIPPNEYQWIIHGGKNVIKDNIKIAKLAPPSVLHTTSAAQNNIDYPNEIEQLEQNIGLLFQMLKQRTSDANNK